MTDPPPPLSDEDLCAALDGDAAPDVAARIAADPVATARQDAMAAAAAAVGSPVKPLSSSNRDRLIANALAAVDDPIDDPVHGPVPAAASPLAGRRRPVPPPWLVAAVVVVVVAVGLALVWSGTRDRRTQQAGSGGAATSGEARSADGADAANSGAAGRTATEAPGSKAPGGAADQESPAGSSTSSGDSAGPVVDLGRFATAEDLRTALASGFGDQQVPDRSGGPPPSTARLDRCAQQVSVTLNGVDEPPPLEPRPDRQGYARIADEQVLVFEFATTTFTAGRSAVVSAVGVDACAPVLTFVR